MDEISKTPVAMVPYAPQIENIAATRLGALVRAAFLSTASIKRVYQYDAESANSFKKAVKRSGGAKWSCRSAIW